jgi:GT2 family glycosyltransferase
MPARVPVTAVLVAHDGSRWLPEALAALDAQSVTPTRVVAVDTGSTDDSVRLLRRQVGHVLELPRTTGFPVAVAAALAAVPADTRWVWLLHDDCAPDPDVLSLLLRGAAASPSAAVLGPKAVDWHDPRVLVEVGVTTDASGVRDPMVEPGELDQGQHDTPRDVLAVGTAGMLIRRDVWESLGGLDPDLPVFRADLDLGWRANAAGHRVVAVPSARVRHVRAATTGRRPLDAASGRLHAVDRRAAWYVLLAHATGWRLGLLLPWLLLIGLLRALGLLLVRRPRAAWDETTALAALLARPGRLRRARRERAARRTVPPRALRPLLSSPVVRARSRLTGLLDRRAARGRPAPPGLLLVLGLTMLTLLAARSLLGSGVLAGGSLLPAPEGARQLWVTYAATAEPSLAVLGVLASVLLGQAGLAVDLLLLGSVPLSGAVAYAVAGHVVRSPLLRGWSAASWALLPVATGAVAGGRLDAAAAHVVLPPLLLAGHRLTRSDPRRSGWSGAWALGLALAATAALSPLLWLLLAALLLATSLLRTAAAAPPQRVAARRRTLAAVLAAGTPVLLLLPWSPGLLSPTRLLQGPGRWAPELAEPALPAWHLLLLNPGGPGTPALIAALGLLLAALGGLLRTRRAPVVAAGWGLALLGLAVALLLARLRVDGLPLWPGVPLDLAAAGMLLAALVGAEGLQQSLTRSSFGWRQLAVVLTVGAAVAVPVVCAGAWLARGADGPLQRAQRDLLPAFVRAELEAAPGRRALLLGERPEGAAGYSVGYAVSGAPGPLLGDRPVRMDEQVAAVLSVPDPDAAAGLAARGVLFVALDGDPAGAAALALDAQPGLTRQPAAPPALWRVEPAAAPVAEPEAPTRLPLLLQVGALLVVGVLAGPGARPRQGLEPEWRP